MGFDFRKIIDLVESFLTESLTKGSLSVMSNPKKVSALADAIRDDSMINAAAFPPGFGKKARNMSDEDLAKWFLEAIDQIEQNGYNGVQYSRNGVNNAWVVDKYISGAHNWEDILGTLSMNLAKWYFLKNRDMLDSQHADIPRFSGVRELGQYMVTHYTRKLEQYEEAARQAAMKKTVRAYKLIDNDDYKVYIIFNRAASVFYGLGSNWCTANSESGYNYQSYSSRAMLFQLYPYDAPEVKVKRGGREFVGNERYQFDGGGPYFMDIADNPADKPYIRERFPYLYDDLVTALNSQKTNLEQFMEKGRGDPLLQSEDSQVKQYEVDEEIAKLSKLATAGWFTNQKRPASPAAQEPANPN